MKLLLLGALAAALHAQAVPEIAGDWWPIAGDPDLGKYTTPKQQPVDFAVWRAADGTWQLWSCIRATAAPGRTRLFYRWQGARLTDRDWAPMGVAMEADPGFGETPGGLQAPYVFRSGRDYFLFYGDWENICHARGVDGKTFARQLTGSGKSGLFSEGAGNNTRDIMILRDGKRWIGYYTAYPRKKGAVYARVSRDLVNWGESKIVAFGGSAGEGPFSSECPFVYYHAPSRTWFLFRTQRYGEDAQTSVYASKNPLEFGVNDDRFLVTRLPLAASEIVEHEGELYIAALMPGLKGIQVARLRFRDRH
jgi:hypothetical protein